MKPTEGSNLVLVRRLLSIAWRYRRGCARLIALQLALLGLGVAALALTGLAIDAIRHAAEPAGAPLPWPLSRWKPARADTWPLVACLALAVLAVAGVRGVLSYFNAVWSNRLVQQQIVVDLRTQVFDKLERLSFGFFSGNSSGSIINRIPGDVQSVRVFIDGVLVQMCILALSLAFYLAYMLRLHAGLTLACLATTPLLWLLSIRFSRSVRPAYDRNRELFDRMLLALTENVRGVHVVKGFARERDQIELFRQANRAVKDQQHWIFWRVSLFTPSIELLTSMNLAILLGYGGYLVVENRLALGSGLIVFSGLLQQFSGQVSKVTNIVNSIQQSLSGARRVFEILDAPIEVESPPAARRLPAARGSIQFERICFAYRAGEGVLDDLCLEVRPGQRVGILGATGAGKTTLLGLVARFHDPTGGRVLIDGIDARSLDLDDLRRNIGVVFQESFLFSDTVAANIAWGRPGADRGQVERAARMAAAHEFIAGLAEGYDTLLGESGKELSGGQRQRLAIARAVILEPPILLMDDPTAAVDPLTEHEILEAMDAAMRGRTTIVVAQRPSVLSRMDLVVVLDKGRIVAAGTHGELMARAAGYRRLVGLQTEAAPPRRAMAS
ncbi:MAG: ABC transporter ATP-binding protein [Pirellulales bacterium]